MSPSIWTVLGLVALAPLVGSGPHWPSMFGSDVKHCQTSWLPVILFYNNWYSYTDMCLPQTWYLSADLQLYFIGTIVVCILYSNPSFGVKACLSGVFISALWLGTIVFVYDLQPTMIWETFDESYRDRMMDLTYLGAMPHLGPFLLGILTGYFIHRFPEYRLGTIKVTFYWLLSAVSMVVVIFAAHPWHNGQWPTRRDAALYQGTHKIVWSFATCWLLFACHKGYAGFLAKFLSWSGFTNLSKLSLLMSLVNIPIIRFKNSVLRRQIYFGFSDLYYDFLGHYCLSIAVSVVLYLLVESPLASVTESYFRDRKKKKE